MTCNPLKPIANVSRMKVHMIFKHLLQYTLNNSAVIAKKNKKQIIYINSKARSNIEII